MRRTTSRKSCRGIAQSSADRRNRDALVLPRRVRRVLGLAFALGLGAPLAGVAQGEPTRVVTHARPVPAAVMFVAHGDEAMPAAGLERLLAVPEQPIRSEAQRTDDSLAAAVARGSTREFDRKSGFRKRSRDLFRTERQIEIGEQEMVVRLRLRAKRRETMSVEVRF